MSWWFLLGFCDAKVLDIRKGMLARYFPESAEDLAGLYPLHDVLLLLVPEVGKWSFLVQS